MSDVETGESMITFRCFIVHNLQFLHIPCIIINFYITRQHVLAVSLLWNCIIKLILNTFLGSSTCGNFHPFYGFLYGLLLEDDHACIFCSVVGVK